MKKIAALLLCLMLLPMSALAEWTEADILSEEGEKSLDEIFEFTEEGDMIAPPNPEYVSEGAEAAFIDPITGETPDWARFYTGGSEEGEDVLYNVSIGSYEWYLMPSESIEGGAYLDIYPTVSPLGVSHDERFDGGQGWLYEFTIEEMRGISFTPAVISLTYFADRNAPQIVGERTRYFADDISGWWPQGCLIPAGSALTFSGECELQDLFAIGLSVVGTDEKGNENEFHALLELSTTLIEEQ